MDVNTFFDKILYINLNNDINRRTKIIEQFKKYGITNYERIEAIASNSFQLTKDVIPEVRNFIKTDFNYIKGSYFCRLSHLKAIKYAKEKNFEKVLILEDDVIFLQDPSKLLKSNINILNDWDMLFFGGLIEHQFRNQIVEAHAYAINQKLYDDIINMAVPSGMEIDNFYAKIIQHMSYNYNQSGKYNIRTITPFNTIIQDKAFQSNIKI